MPYVENNNVKAWGAKGDGLVDDTPALNAMFEILARQEFGRAPIVVFFPKGTYLISGPLYPDGKNFTGAASGLRIIGEPGAVIKARGTTAQWSGTRSGMFTFHNSATPGTDIWIEGLIFDGNLFGTTNFVATGIWTAAVTGLTIKNCTFRNIGDTGLGEGSAPRNDGIILGDNGPEFSESRRAKDVRVEQCRFVNCVRNGISILDADGVMITDCYFDNMDNAGIDIEPNFNYQFARNITIANNTFLDNASEAIVAIPGGSLVSSTYPDQMECLKIHGNFIDGNLHSVRGVLVSSWIDVDITSNTVIKCADFGLQIRGSTGVRLRTNHIRETNVSGGSHDASCGIVIDKPSTPQPTDYVIQGNTIKNTRGYGIQVVALNGGSITGNIIRDYDQASGTRRGIDLTVGGSTCKNISIVGNTIVGSPNGKPMLINSACTRILVVGNLCQETGSSTATDSIDNDAASSVQGLNADDQRTDRKFVSAGGTTPLSAGPIGQTGTARQLAYVVVVAGGAGAGSVSTVSDLINSLTGGQIVFAPANAAASTMMGNATPPYITMTTTGFDFVHNGNGGTAANFACVGFVI